MKQIIYILLLLVAMSSHAQLLVNDFATGTAAVTHTNELNTDSSSTQTGAMISGKRKIVARLSQDSDKQGVRYGVLNKKLVASFGYNSRGVIKVIYGHGAELPNLDVDLTKFTKLVVTYEGLSENAPFYISLFTNSQRAVYSTSVSRRPGVYRLEIPFSKFDIIGKGFKWNDLDSMVFQFGASALTGNNFAITRIEFQ